MPQSSGFEQLGDYKPTAAKLCSAVDIHYESGVSIIGMGENDSGVTFAGAGEPLLRLKTLLDTGALCFE